LIFNDAFFDNRICFRGWEVRFATNQECGGNYGTMNPKKRAIFINKDIRRMRTVVHIILLHEMPHLLLYQQGYIGYPGDTGGHSVRFHAEMDRLYQIGAYEGLL
jgi:hypothetical protein